MRSIAGADKNVGAPQIAGTASTPEGAEADKADKAGKAHKTNDASCMRTANSTPPRLFLLQTKPNSRAMTAVSMHTRKPRASGIRAEIRVHFLLPVSLKIVSRVVLQGL